MAFQWTPISSRDPVVSARQINNLGRAVEALVNSSAPDSVRGSSGLVSRISPNPKYKKYYKIISNEDDGEYVVREQRLDPATTAFKDFETTNDRTAYECKFNVGGIADEIYPGWKTLTFDGEEVIIIDMTSQGLFPVKVTQTGGSAGSKTTKCSFTYTVDSIGGEELATVQTPSKNRPVVGKMKAPTADDYGLAFYNGATLVLYDANETLAASAC